MSEQVIDALARRAVGSSRRDSLLTMGTAGVALLAQPARVEASKSGKKSRKKARKQAKKKCKKQAPQCTEFVEDLCADTGPSLVCEAKLSPCCDFLAQCQTTAFLTCIFENAA